MEKRAVILAGGRGTRLKPFTVALPKPLVPVGDRPILEIIVHQLVPRASGISPSRSIIRRILSGPTSATGKSIAQDRLLAGAAAAEHGGAAQADRRPSGQFPRHEWRRAHRYRLRETVRAARGGKGSHDFIRHRATLSRCPRR